jgi:tellurite resistance protein
LQLCCDILCLGYACAASDGPVSTEEDDHLQGWLWCVVENTSDQEATTIHQALVQASEQCKIRGKQKLEVVTKLGEAIRATGEKKLIQAAAELCGEIVAHDGRLEPGEYATLSTALKGLGVRNIKAAKIADELLSGDDEIAELLEELDIETKTPSEERERKLSIEWSRQNARMQAVTDSGKREEMRRRMELIQRIRDLYREIDRHG